MFANQGPQFQGLPPAQRTLPVGLSPRYAAFALFLREDMRPRGRLTFCNLFVSAFFEYFGFSGFRGRLANDFDMVARSSRGFVEMGLSEWVTSSPSNQFGFACLSGSPHGHVVLLLDSLPSFSPSFECLVPHCVDVGRNYSWDVPISRAFKSIPKLFKFSPAAPITKAKA